MSTPVPDRIAAAWDSEGERIGAQLDARSCVVVAGTDPEAAAHVALGIARVQARRRRVAVADLVGELYPL